MPPPNLPSGTLGLKCHSGFALINVLVGLTLALMGIVLMTQSIASAVRAERQARERFVAMQWLAGALDELRATGSLPRSRPQLLDQPEIAVRSERLTVGRLSRVTLTARWREPSAGPRTATLTGIVPRPPT